MRAVVVGPTHPFRGGIAHYTSALVQRLIDRGHVTTLISYRRQYPRWLYPGLSDTDPSETYQSMPALFMLDPLNPISWWRTANAIAQLKPDLVNIQWWTTYWSPAYMTLVSLLKAKGLRAYYLVHNVLPHEFHVGDRELTRLTLRLSAGCIVWTDADRNKLQKLVPQLPAYVCPMPMCPLPTTALVSQEVARQQLHIPEGLPVVIFFGFVRHYKGLHYLIEAVARLRDEGTPVYLLVAGECWEKRSEYDRQIVRLGLGDLVRLEGRYIRNEDVSTYFSAANMLVAPYIELTQSAVSTLAIKYGIPLVMSRPLAQGSDTYVDNAKVKVVPEADAQALAQAIHAFCFNEWTRTPMAANADDGWDRLVTVLEQLSDTDHY
jgi:D-inositol-3-phosphate glycosyltransferase